MVGVLIKACEQNAWHGQLFNLYNLHLSSGIKDRSRGQHIIAFSCMAKRIKLREDNKSAFGSLNA